MYMLSYMLLSFHMSYFTRHHNIPSDLEMCGEGAVYAWHYVHVGCIVIYLFVELPY